MDDLKIKISITDATYLMDLIDLIDRQLKQPDNKSDLVESLTNTKNKLDDALGRAIIVI